MKITPEKIISLDDNEIFVFGSNYAGRHGKGAALLALRKFGARTGQGTGMMGKSYGIATKDHRLKRLPLDTIEKQILSFIKYAIKNPEKQFLVTKIGCGLAGYKTKEIANLWLNKNIPKNISLPIEFIEIITMNQKG